MRGISVFFPMASHQGPVGYAELGIGEVCREWARLPAANFDVHTAADAWASLRAGELWPAVEPDRALCWRASFEGSPGEVDAGRSRGKSAHLALLLATAAHQAGALTPGEPGALRLWASGEMDRDGRLGPVDGLDHKLRLFFEHWRCQPGPTVFVAPAANRATLDLASLGQPLKEVLFERGKPLPSPDPGCPLLLWVNRGDVGALVERLLNGGGWRPARRRWPALLTGLVAVGLLALVPWLGSLLRGAPVQDAARLDPPGVLGGARLALRLGHGWRFEHARVAAAVAGARVEGAWVVWEQALEDYAPAVVGPCGPGHHLPSRVRLRFALGAQSYWAGALGEDAECLSVVRPPWGAGHLALVSENLAQEWAYYPRGVFDPRETLLAVAMVHQVGALARRGLLGPAPGDVEQLMRGPSWTWYQATPQPIQLLHQALHCCGPDNAATDSSVCNRRCPQPGAAVYGEMERSFRLHALDPRSAYLGFLVGGADKGNRASLTLDDRPPLVCEGPFYLRAFRIGEPPALVRMWAERAWSHSQVEVSAAVLAEGLSFSEARQSPARGLDEDPAPTCAHVEPGLTGVPEVIFWDDFDAPALDPAWRTRGEVAVVGRRLRLLRAGGEYGEVSRDLPESIEGAWRVELTLALATEDSVASACLVDRTWSRRTCMTLNNSTENGKQAGAHLFCDALEDGVDLLPGRELVQHGFQPGAGEPHRLALERDATGRIAFRLDGALRGSLEASCVSGRFDQLHLLGFQDSSPGHGGYVDDLIIYRQPHSPLRGRPDTRPEHD